MTHYPRRVKELERVMPSPDLSTLTDAELALADPFSTPTRRMQAEDALPAVAEVLA